MNLAILIFSFFITQNAFAFPKLSISEANPPQFTFEITDEGLGLLIVETKNSRRTNLKPKFSVSDVQKLHIIPQDKASDKASDKAQDKNGLTQKVELLLVVLFKGAQVQIVQVYVPSADSKIIKSSQTDPICEFENFGDFSWENPSDLNSRVRLIKKGTRAQLELKIGRLTNPSQQNSVQALWKKCFSF